MEKYRKRIEKALGPTFKRYLSVNPFDMEHVIELLALVVDQYNFVMLHTYQPPEKEKGDD